MNGPQYQEVRFECFPDHEEGIRNWTEILDAFAEAGSYVLSTGGGSIVGQGTMVGALIQGSPRKADEIKHARAGRGGVMTIVSLLPSEAEELCRAFNRASLAEMRERCLARIAAPGRGDGVRAFDHLSTASE